MELPKPVTEFMPVHMIIMQSLTAEAVMCAVDMKLFDHVAQGAASPAEIGAKCGVDPFRLEPLLNLLAAHDLLLREGDGYATTPVAEEYLVSTAPLYQGKAMGLTLEFNRMVGRDMAALLRDGQTAREETDALWAVDEAMEGTAQDAMGGAVQAVTEFISGLDGFSNFTSMCDIGGNHGQFSMALVDLNPDLHALLCDLPHVAEAAKKRCEAMGYGHRIETHGLDMRTDELPNQGFDLVLTSHLLYGFKTDLGVFLSKVARALKPGGWFVSQHYAPDVGAPCPAARAALDLVTRAAGYLSHHISREELEAAASQAGLEEFKTATVSEQGWGLIFGARKPLA